jgi:broad specificity phosphatase PhoE
MAAMQFHLPNHPTQLIFIRHGEVEERYHQVFGGCKIDMELSPLGLAQGVAIERWFGQEPIHAVYASPMRRVQQTLAPLLSSRQLTPSLLQDLREVDFGEWTGLRWQEVKELFGVSAFDWLEVLDRGELPGGESAQHLMARVRPCLDFILAQSPHQRVVVACHGGIIRVMLSLLLDLPLARTAHFNIDYGSITVVEVQPEKKHAVELELLNYQPLRHTSYPQ